MRINILIAIALFISGNIFSQNIKGTVTTKDGSALIGVTVFWKGTTEGQATDINGKFNVTRNNKSKTLVVKYLGYLEQEIKIKDSDKKLDIILVEDEKTLDEVEVVGKSSGAYISRLDPINSTNITGEELCKAACCSLAESFTTNPSIDVSYSDAATGAKQIRLLGLSGLYVQMMAENMPAFRGLASVYGLEYIPGPWMDAIQVSKGTSSVINGYEAITGQINVEYKKPQNSEIFFINAFGSSSGRTELNLNGSVRINKHLSTMILAHAKNDIHGMDENNDGFLDMPMVKQLNLINRWQYKKGIYGSQYAVKYINENRNSGQKAFYDNDTTAYGINIKTERFEAFTKQGFVFDDLANTSLGIQAAGSFHKHESFYGNTKYDAAQTNGYLNAIFQSIINDDEAHKYSVGASVMYDNYDEKLDNVKYLREEIVPGIFAQYTYNLNDKLILLGGIRGDYHNEYGFFATPRFHAKYNINDHINLRANVGMGYRSANILSENSYLFASSRKFDIADNLDQEKALNVGLSSTVYFNIFDREATWATDYYYTNFFSQVVADIDSDPHKVSFYNLDGKSYSHAIQTQLSYEILRGLDLLLAYRHTDVKMTINGTLREKALTNRYKGLIGLNYQTPLKKWQFDFTSQFNGGGRMPDGDGWDREFKPFTVLNTQITKYFRTWSIYIGGENLTNFKMENPIIDASNPWSDNFDASMVWGPTHGIKVYAGVRWAINRK